MNKVVARFNGAMEYGPRALGNRSILYHAKEPAPWQTQIQARRPANVVAVAVAHKMARTAWAILAHGRPYQQNYVSVQPV